MRIAQSRFITLIGDGARLERALISFMLDLHSTKGYTEVMPPILVNSASLTGSGQLPKFAEESFRCADDDLWLTPTAEVPLTSLHRDEVIAVEQLPLKYSAYTPCFRREAGSYGRDTGGAWRNATYNCTSYNATPCDATSVDRFGDYVTETMRGALTRPHGASLLPY